MAENNPCLKSVLPFLPPLKIQPSLSWPNDRVIATLEKLSKGPNTSGVRSGSELFDTITELGNALSLPSHRLAKSTGDGFAYYFDECVSEGESEAFFTNVVPNLATLFLQLPNYLQAHYANDSTTEDFLRPLGKQQFGTVHLAKVLVAALLACSFFCLFPTAKRKTQCLPDINLDQLFASIYERRQDKQINKIKCILHYFERVCSCTPSGFVSFERKVLPMEDKPAQVKYPNSDFWENSNVPLCQFWVHSSGAIEDHSTGSLEVDFADKSFGGLVLTSGCLQEEIRFLINPELIVGMLFLSTMAENEAVEIVGAERFSTYTGYDCTFEYSGDYVDKAVLDLRGRPMRRIIAIDALQKPGKKQYSTKLLLREVNKAFCGFLDRPKFMSREHDNAIGVISGNWGCGVFGGDPELKVAIQWLAASQALRPFISYHTFKLEQLKSLDKVCERIASHRWTVGDLWNRMNDYSSKRAIGKTKLSFLSWILQINE